MIVMSPQNVSGQLDYVLMLRLNWPNWHTSAFVFLRSMKVPFIPRIFLSPHSWKLSRRESNEFVSSTVSIPYKIWNESYYCKRQVSIELDSSCFFLNICMRFQVFIVVLILFSISARISTWHVMVPARYVTWSSWGTGVPSLNLTACLPVVEITAHFDLLGSYWYKWKWYIL